MRDSLVARLLWDLDQVPGPLLLSRPHSLPLRLELAEVNAERFAEDDVGPSGREATVRVGTADAYTGGNDLRYAEMRKRGPPSKPAGKSKAPRMG